MTDVDDRWRTDDHGGGPERDNAMSLSIPTLTVHDFLDIVAALLRRGLPAEVWLEATVLAAKASRHGHTLELVDPAIAGRACLRVFLAEATRPAIGRDFGLDVDPLALIGMTTMVKVAPTYDPRFGLSGRVVALSSDVEVGLRRERLMRVVAQLKRDGLFEAQRRLAAPRDVTRITVLHPTGAAGWADVAAELGRLEQAGLLVVRSVPVAFEGERATAGLIAALSKAAEPLKGHSPDLVAIVRGGGSRAGLLVFDNEQLAIAICRCPVPVLIGVGHAIDTGLLCGLVAWRRADTPSKAVRVVTDLMAQAARKAAADHALILTEAARQAARAVQASIIARQQIGAGVERGLHRASAKLGALWATALVSATATCAHVTALDAAAAHLKDDVLLAAASAIARQEHRMSRVLTDGLDKAARALGRHDVGAAILAAVGSAATTALTRQSASLDQSYDRVAAEAARQLDAAEHAAARHHLLIDGHDPLAILRRSYVLVTDHHGRALPTRAAAVEHAAVSLRFGDGTLDVAIAG